MRRRLDALQRQGVRSGRLDVGRLFVDTKQVYLDARANAAELDIPKLRVDVMFSLVDMLGELIREVTRLRASITRGEEGLAGFDEDLAGLRQRYHNLYRPFFEDLPPVEEWNDETWKSFEEDLEGPILLWDLQTCQERWGVAFASPPCEGPDLQMALSLVHQTGVALEHQEQLIASVYGIANLTLKDIAETYGNLGKAAGRKLASALAKIGENAKDYILPNKTTKGFAWGLGVAAVLGVGGYVLLNQSKTNNNGR